MLLPVGVKKRAWFGSGILVTAGKGIFSTTEKATSRQAAHIGTLTATVTLTSCRAAAGPQMKFGGGKIHILTMTPINRGIAIPSKTRDKSSITTRYSATSTVTAKRNWFSGTKEPRSFLSLTYLRIPKRKRTGHLRKYGHGPARSNMKASQRLTSTSTAR